VLQRSDEGLPRSAEEPLEVVGAIQGVNEWLEVHLRRRRHEGIQFGVGMEVEGEGKGAAGTPGVDAIEGKLQVAIRISAHGQTQQRLILRYLFLNGIEIIFDHRLFLSTNPLFQVPRRGQVDHPFRQLRLQAVALMQILADCLRRASKVLQFGAFGLQRGALSLDFGLSFGHLFLSLLLSRFLGGVDLSASCFGRRFDLVDGFFGLGLDHVRRLHQLPRAVVDL